MNAEKLKEYYKERVTKHEARECGGIPGCNICLENARYIVGDVRKRLMAFSILHLGEVINCPKVISEVKIKVERG